MVNTGRINKPTHLTVNEWFAKTVWVTYPTTYCFDFDAQGSWCQQPTWISHSQVTVEKRTNQNQIFNPLDPDLCMNFNQFQDIGRYIIDNNFFMVW